MANPFLAIGLSAVQTAQKGAAQAAKTIKDIPIAPDAAIGGITKPDLIKAAGSTLAAGAVVDTAISQTLAPQDPYAYKPSKHVASMQDLYDHAFVMTEDQDTVMAAYRALAKTSGASDQDTYWAVAKSEALDFDLENARLVSKGSKPYSEAELKRTGKDILAPWASSSADSLVEYARHAPIAYNPAELVARAGEEGITPTAVIEQLRNRGVSNSEIYRAFDSVWRRELIQEQARTGEAITYEQLEPFGLGFLASEVPEEVVNETLAWEEIPDQPEPLMAQNPYVKAKGLQNQLDPEDISTYINAAEKIRELPLIDLQNLMGSPVISQIRQELNHKAIQAIEEQGYSNVRFDEQSNAFLVLDEKTGEWIDFESPWWQQMISNNLGEIAGGITGALLSAQSIPQARPIARAGVTLMGAAAFAGAGRAYDTVRAAQELNTTLTLPQLASVAAGGFIDDAVFTAGFGATVKTLGLANPKFWRNASQFVDNAQADGGYKALVRALGYTEDQLRDKLMAHSDFLSTNLVSRQFRLGGPPTIGDKANIVLYLRGEPAALPYVRASVTESGIAAPGIAAETTKRAQVLESRLSDITADNFTDFLKKDLRDYATDVKQFYRSTVEEGAANSQGIKYNLDSVFPVQEYLDKMLPTLDKQGLGGDLAAQIVYLKDLAANENNLGGIIAMRHAINRIAYHPTYSKAFTNKQVFRDAVDSIDLAIEQTSQFMPDGAKWMEKWGRAKAEYGKMKTMQDSALYKVLSDPNVDPSSAIKSFTDSLTYTDPSEFMHVMDSLTPASRLKAEGAVIKALTANRTTALDESLRAIDYPALAKDLSYMRFATKEGRALQSTINDMAELYKTDPTLLQIATNTSLGHTSNNIGIHLKSKVDIAIATQKFKVIQAFIPTTKSREKRMVQLLSRFLDEPLNKNLRDDLIKSAENKDALREAIDQYATEFSRWGMKKNFGMVPLFHEAGTGTKRAYLSPSAANAAGVSKPEMTQVPLRSIARPADYKDADVWDVATQALLKNNYLGASKGDELLLFK